MVCEEEYEILDQIGRGSYGKVYRAQHDSGEVHAIKVVELEAAEDDLDSIQQEIKMLQAFNCPQLTRYHGSFIVGSALWISMEYLEGGSLQELIKTSKTNLDEHTTQWVLREILKALVYLHTERKIHRDVKAGNILVASDGSVRLADFGESVQLTHSIAKRQTFAGSPYWMAPEVIMAQDTYNSKADIWSLGVTAIEMIKGRPPYSEMHPMKAVLCIPNNPPPTLGKDGHYNKHFHTFLEQCFQRDPNLRPSAQDLLKHPFMKAARQTDALSKLLEARRAAEMMKNLFGGGEGGGLLNSTAPQLDATHKAKTTTLPASVAAAIAAAQAAAGNGSKGSNALDSSFDPKTASVEWDFGDGDGDGDGDRDGDDGFTQAASLAAAGLGEFDFRSPKAVAAVAAAEGGSRGGVSPGGVASPPSPGAVTPKARGGSGGMWLDHTPEAEKGHASATLKGPPPLAERQRRRGKMAKVGHLLGIDDAAGAATLQAQMTVLARQQEEELVRRQKAGGLGSWASSSSVPATPNSTDSRKVSTSSSSFSSQQQQQQQRASSSLFGKGGGRNVSCSSGSTSPTPSSTATAALTPARADAAFSSSQEMATTTTHASSLSSASAPVCRGGGHGDSPKSGSMFGRLLRGTNRDNGRNGRSSSTDGAGGGGRDTAARPHAASHDLTAHGGGALQEAAVAARSKEAHRETGGEAMRQAVRGSKLVAAEGRGDSASEDLSGLDTGAGGGSDQAESQPSTLDPSPPSSASGSVSWPALPPMRWATGGDDGEATTRNRIDGGDGVEGEEKEAAVHGVDTEVAEPPLPFPAPLRTRRSWEQDDVGNLADCSDVDDAGGRTRLGGAAAIPEGEGEGDGSAATLAEAGQPRQREAVPGETQRSGEPGVHSSGSKEVMCTRGGSASASAVPQEVGGEGVVKVAGESGASPATSTINSKGREGGTENTGPFSLPPLSPAVAVPAAVASTAESMGGSGALGDGGAAETSGHHFVSQSSLTMPWGTCGFGNISESPGGDSTTSTAGVLGVGTSEAPLDMGEGRAIVDDDDWNNSSGSEPPQGADVENRGEGREVAGAPAGGERGDNSDIVITSSEHDDRSQPGSEVPASPASATRESLDDGGAAAPLEAPGSAAAGAVALEDGGGVVVAEEGEAAGAAAAAAPRDAGEEEDRLTAAFHAHLTPALCELWDATEDGSAQRQAVQDLAMALERLDGCGNGELTLDFVGAVAKSWPTGEATRSTADETLPSPG